jgi:hypothetical protein
MPFWYYLPVPKPPPEISHQSNIIEIRKYLAPEGSAVDVGTPIAVIENHWAVMTLKANRKGILRKTFFEPGTSVKVGAQSLSSVPTEKIFPTRSPMRQWT